MLRPTKKFRTPILNLSKSLIYFAFLKPGKFINEQFSVKSLKTIPNLFYNPNQSDELKAFSAAFGIFMGIIPVWGLQTLLAIVLAAWLKLNKTIVIIFSQVSFPLFFPVVVFLSYRTGEYWMGEKSTGIAVGGKISPGNINKHLGQYIYGSVTLSIVAGIATGLLTFALLKLLKVIKNSYHVEKNSINLIADLKP